MNKRWNNSGTACLSNTAIPLEVLIKWENCYKINSYKGGLSYIYWRISRNVCGNKGKGWREPRSARLLQRNSTIAFNSIPLFCAWTGYVWGDKCDFKNYIYPILLVWGSLGGRGGSPLGWCGLSQPWRRFWSHDNYCTLKAAEETHLLLHLCQIPESSTRTRLKPDITIRSKLPIQEATQVIISEPIPCGKRSSHTQTETNSKSYMRGGSAARPAAQTVFIQGVLHVINIKHDINAGQQLSRPRGTGCNTYELWTHTLDIAVMSSVVFHSTYSNWTSLVRIMIRTNPPPITDSTRC